VWSTSTRIVHQSYDGLVTPAAYLDSVAALPSPSATQLDAFAEHLCNAHSWYKHIPLVTGAEFVVFLAADAGAGFEDRDRMHYGWKRSAEYRARFGHLDYCWRDDNAAPYDRDGIHPDDEPTPPELLDPELRTRFGFRLYPMVSTDINGMEAIHYDLHADALDALRRGAPHPYRARILAWAAHDREFDELYSAVTADDRDHYHELQRLHGDAIEDAEYRAEPPPNILALPEVRAIASRTKLHRMLEIDEALRLNYAAMAWRERAKITAALAQLVSWHDTLRG
jgi:hypothetical protein